MTTKTATVTLSEPLAVNGEEVTEITLRKPSAGELRGCSMLDLMRLDVGAYLRLLPRITTPPLDAGHLDAIDLADFIALTVAAQGFFGSSKGSTTS